MQKRERKSIGFKSTHKKKPDWLKVPLHYGKSQEYVKGILKSRSLHTVCEEAACPNRTECFGKKTAAFMILGNVCTRRCAFCNVRSGKPGAVDRQEPGRVAEAAAGLGLKHVVVTSVTRDDLADGGAGQFALTVQKLKSLNKNLTVEVLVPDFQGSLRALKKVVDSGPHIINHNVETVPRLYPEVRPLADYARSLDLIKGVKALSAGIYAKSGLMLGFGEDAHEVIEVLRDLRRAGCDFITLGQYLSPSKSHFPVMEYIHPGIFESYRIKCLEMGFKNAASAPLVRSSYHAESFFKTRPLKGLNKL